MYIIGHPIDDTDAGLTIVLKTMVSILLPLLYMKLHGKDVPPVSPYHILKLHDLFELQLFTFVYESVNKISGQMHFGGHSFQGKQEVELNCIVSTIC